MPIPALRNRINASIFISAIYFIAWSVVVMIKPTLLSAVVIGNANTPLVFWDFLGLITGVMGISLFIAAFDPYKHWLIIFMATLFHVSIMCGFFAGVQKGWFTDVYLPFLFFNHLIWLIPNGIVLFGVYRRSLETDALLMSTFNSEDYPLEIFETTKGIGMDKLAHNRSVLLVFLRHFGCPFCKESLMNLAALRAQLEAEDTCIVLVYMVDEQTAQQYLVPYHLEDLHQVSDPEEIFYKSFQLRRGTFRQLFGWKVWMRWVQLGVRKQLFNTSPAGDVSQMPGVFLLRDGKIIRQYVHSSVADSTDFTMFLNVATLSADAP